MADLLHERSVHELAAFYQHSVPARENGAIEKPINLMENIHLVSSTEKEKIIWPAGHIGLAVSAVGLKKSSGREPLTGSSSAPIETRQFRST